MGIQRVCAVLWVSMQRQPQSHSSLPRFMDAESRIPSAPYGNTARARFDLSGLPMMIISWVFRRAISATQLVRLRVRGFMGEGSNASL